VTPTKLLYSVLLAGLLGANASAATLRDCYEWAEAHSEQLKIRQEGIARNKALARAAIGRALPRVEFDASDTWQDPNGVNQLDAQGFSGFVQKDQVESRFSLVQPIFSGLREWSALYGLRRETARDTLLIRTASGQVYDRTADAFYGALANETEKSDNLAALELAEERAAELARFLKLGKARESEVYAARSHAAALRGALARSGARIQASREELSRLTGKDLSSEPLVDELPTPPAVDTVSSVLARAEDRSDIRAQREDVAAKEWRIRYEKGFYWPSIDLSGNYYLKRPAYLDAIKWDVKLNASVPLFQGGSVAANVDAAKAEWRQSKLALDELENLVKASVRSAREELAASVEDYRALEASAADAKSGYDALMKEYDLGLTTNLEVMTALDQLQQQTSARDAARFYAKRQFVRLGVATEVLP
jgi:outer membrane protein